MDFAPLVPLLQALPDMANRVAISATIADALEAPVTQDRYLWLASPNGTTDKPGTLGRVVEQWHQVRFSVVTLVRNVADTTGAGALKDMAELRAALVAALLDQQPGADYQPISHVRDAALRWREGKLYWADEFATGLAIRPAGR
jgi:hypothetical protein